MITKLGVGTATQGDMKARTAFSLATALRNVSVPWQLFLAEGCYIHQNRDTIVRQSLENGCSHLLFVDSDVVFGQHAISKLIDADKDIVAGRYNKRILPIEPTVKEEIKGLSEVKFVPSGFLLINTGVFKKIGSPYFFFDNASDSSDDLFFCNKAIKAGYKVWCDPTIEIGHLGMAVY